MIKDPILASRTLPPSKGYRVNRTFTVHGGLRYNKGNKAPCFTLTCWSHRKGFPSQCQSGGCDHDTILKYYPQFADLAALHLSDIDGKPMYAVDNGWHDLAGSFDNGASQRYHAGNAERHFPVTPPTDKPWQDTEYREPTAAECLAFFAKFWRIDLTEAEQLRTAVSTAIAALPNGWLSSSEAIKSAAIGVLTEARHAMLPRWKAQADTCIAKHGLIVYGDPWTPPVD